MLKRITRKLRDVLLWSGQTNVCAAPRGCITVSAYWRAHRLQKTV